MLGLIRSRHARELLPTRSHRAPPAGRLGIGFGLATLVLYALTGSRGVDWQDSGVHQYRILVGQLEHPFGLALSHPLHYWLGRATLLVPLGDPLHRLNLLSGVFGAVGVGVLAALVVQLTRSRLAGGLAAGTLALAHSYWQMSARTDTYTIAGALLTVEWLLLLRYARSRHPGWLIAVFAVNGLHVADHLLGLLSLATYGVLLLDRLARRRVNLGVVVVAIVAWAVTSAPYSALVFAQWQRTGDLLGTVRTALFGGSGQSSDWSGHVLNVQLSLGQIKQAVAAYGYCFPSAALLVALVGVWRRARGRTRLFRYVLWAQTIIILGFVGRYNVPDVYKYFVPVCVVTALWFGCGVGVLVRRWRRGTMRRWAPVLYGANLLLPLAVYFYFPILAERQGWLRGQMRPIPFRNEYRHFFRPWRQGDESAAVFSRQALAAIGDGGWLLADSTTAYTVAASYLVYGGPPGARVYWWVNCLTDAELPKLTDEELLAFVEGGGYVLAAPASVPSEVENTVHPPLLIDRTEPFWHIRRAPGP